MQTLIIVHVPGTSLDYQWLCNSEILKVLLHTLKSAVTPLLLSISCLYRFSISKYLINRKKNYTMHYAIAFKDIMRIVDF